MKDDHMTQLISDHLHGTLTPEQRQDLEQRLLHSAADRERFWQEAETHAMLHEALQASIGTEVAPTPVTARVMPRWITWRPLTAAAAGIVFGIFCTSMLFGYALPQAVTTASRLFELVDGSFEKQVHALPSGLPSKFGVWSGDKAEVIKSGTNDAADGSHMLRFIQAELESALPKYGAASCDVYQLVDLRPLKAEAALGDATLELSVQFLDAREASGQRMEFMSKLYLFSGQPNALLSEWPISQSQALAAGANSCESTGGTPQFWRTVITKSLLPAEADFAVVHLLAHQPDNKMENKHGGLTPALFRQQFADDVRLTLKTQPTLPVRLAQR